MSVKIYSPTDSAFKDVETIKRYDANNKAWVDCSSAKVKENDVWTEKFKQYVDVDVSISAKVSETNDYYVNDFTVECTPCMKYNNQIMKGYINKKLTFKIGEKIELWIHCYASGYSDENIPIYYNGSKNTTLDCAGHYTSLSGTFESKNIIVTPNLKSITISASFGGSGNYDVKVHGYISCNYS